MHPKEGGGGELRASEGARRRSEVMFSMSSDVMRKVSVKFMNTQDTGHYSLERYTSFLILTDECGISGVRRGIKWFVKRLFF